MQARALSRLVAHSTILLEMCHMKYKPQIKWSYDSWWDLTCEGAAKCPASRDLRETHCVTLYKVAGYYCNPFIHHLFSYNIMCSNTSLDLHPFESIYWLLPMCFSDRWLPSQAGHPFLAFLWCYSRPVLSPASCIVGNKESKLVCTSLRWLDTAFSGPYLTYWC